MRHSHPSMPRGSKNRDTSNRTRTCNICKEPADYTKQLKRADGTEIWICDPCVIRLKNAVKAKHDRSRQDSVDVREAFRNSSGDRRRGSEEKYTGGAIDADDEINTARY